jgi:hypothetical protein
MDPMIEQFCRIGAFPGGLRVDWFRQFQRYLAEVVEPQLAKVEPLELENEKLREALAQVRAEKRGPGRPRKEEPVSA